MLFYKKNAERLVDSSALKLFNKSDPNSSEFPSEITALCGQQFVFKLSLSEYNINHGSDTFTVNKVFEPDYTLEKKYKDTIGAKDDALNLVNNMEDDNGTQQSESVIVATTPMRKRKFVVEEKDNNGSGEI